MVLAERLLQRREVFTVRQTFDSDDLGTVRLCRQHQTWANCSTVDDHGARPAHTVLTAEMRAREFQLMAQAVGQAGAGVDGHFGRRAVHRETRHNGVHADSFSPAAARNARSTNVCSNARR